MPCNCDHMEPTYEEIKFSRIACLLDEFKGKKKVDKTHWKGFHPDVYSQTYDKYQTVREGMEDELVQQLLGLSARQLQNYSLEMQIWWRDYQVENTKITKAKFEEQRIQRLRDQGISKLSKEEAWALGLTK